MNYGCVQVSLNGLDMVKEPVVFHEIEREWIVFQRAHASSSEE